MERVVSGMTGSVSSETLHSDQLLATGGRNWPDLLATTTGSINRTQQQLMKLVAETDTHIVCNLAV